MDRNAITPDEIQNITDLKKIPILTKEIIKKNYEDLISKRIHYGEYLIDYTGGSTSEPMKFLIDAESIPKELAFLKYIWEQFGYKLGTPCIELKGAKVAIVGKNIFWKYDPLLKFLKMDSDYINEKFVYHYVNKINQFNSNFLFGFPSSIYLLAKQIERNKLVLTPKIKLIILASENTYDWQIDYIKKIFNCDNIFYHYGHSEKAVMAVKCQNQNILHFLPQYGYTELLNSRGNDAKPGESAEIIVTSYNKLFPLIRYQTKDFAVPLKPECGCIWENFLSASHIEGRLQEFIVTKDKRLVSICTMGAAHFKDLNQVLRTQYYQDTEGKITFKIEFSKNQLIDKKLLIDIKKSLEDKLEGTVDVDVKIVDSIHKSIRGKHLMIEQKLEINNYL